MNSTIAMYFNLEDATLLEELESIRMKTHGSWVGGIIKEYDAAREVGTIETEDGEELVFSRSAVACLKYNGGRTCVTHRWPITKAIKAGLVVIAHTNGVNTGTVVPWQPERMRPVCDARNMFTKTRFVHENNVVWSGFGYYLIDQNYPKDEYPLSDTTRIEVFVNDQWVALTFDPRGMEYSQCSK